MSWSFKPGDRVVCVDASPTGSKAKSYLFGLIKRRVPTGTTKLVAGEVYTITNVAEGTNLLTGVRVVGVQLAELPAPDWFPGGGYEAFRFRPVRTTSIESLRAHLNTIPANRSVDA